MNRCFQLVVLALVLSASSVFALPLATDTIPVSPFDRLDRAKLAPIDKGRLPDITVGVVTVDSGSVLSCAFSSDGKLATGTDQGEVFLWDLTNTTPSQIEKLTLEKGRIYYMAFSTDGKRFAAAIEGKLYVYDLTADGAKQLGVTVVTRIYGLTFSPDGKLIAAGCIPGYLIEVQADRLVTLPTPLQGAQSNFCFTSDGKMFASVFFQPARNGNLYGSEVKFWQISKNKPTEYNLVQLDTTFKAVALTSNNKRMATANLDKMVRIWDITKEVPEVTAKMASPNWVRSLAFTPDGAYLSAFTSGANIILYDVAKGEEKSSWEFKPQMNSDFAVGAMFLLFSGTAAAPDGRHLAFSNHTTKTVILRLPIADELRGGRN